MPDKVRDMAWLDQRHVAETNHHAPGRLTFSGFPKAGNKRAGHAGGRRVVPDEFHLAALQRLDHIVALMADDDDHSRGR